MRLSDDFEEDRESGSFSLLSMIIIVCFFMVLLFGVIFAINNRGKSTHKKTEEEAIVQQELPDDAQAIKDRTDKLVSGSSLRSDDLDFWNMYPEEEVVEETEKTEEKKVEEEKPDPSTDGKHTLVTYASGKEEWVSINPYIKKNNYDTTNLVCQNNIMKYYEGSRLTSKLGVDISKKEGTVDFAALKEAGVDFVMIRTGSRGYESGLLMQDDYFVEHIDGALEAGLEVGLYFDSAAITPEEAKEEAQTVISFIMDRKITYPIAFAMGFADNDTSRIDDLSPAMRTDIARAFLDEIAAAGYRGMIYGDKEWLIKEIEISKLGDFDFWLSMPGDLPDYPYAFSIWQYAISQNISGISGPARVNISFIDYSEK
ncbi:MAG: GH25 family lysozyme [Lachnospiraceae bacterium]|nr:GH25 family lysozyme [Lachnospiraceae bacterium]